MYEEIFTPKDKTAKLPATSMTQEARTMFSRQIARALGIIASSSLFALRPMRKIGAAPEPAWV